MLLIILIIIVLMVLTHDDLYVNGVFVLGLIVLLDGNVDLTWHHDLAHI